MRGLGRRLSGRELAAYLLVAAVVVVEALLILSTMEALARMVGEHLRRMAERGEPPTTAPPPLPEPHRLVGGFIFFTLCSILITLVFHYVRERQEGLGGDRADR